MEFWSRRSSSVFAHPSPSHRWYFPTLCIWFSVCQHRFLLLFSFKPKIFRFGEFRLKAAQRDNVNTFPRLKYQFIMSPILSYKKGKLLVLSSSPVCVETLWPFSASRIIKRSKNFYSGSRAKWMGRSVFVFGPECPNEMVTTMIPCLSRAFCPLLDSSWEILEISGVIVLPDLGIAL